MPTRPNVLVLVSHDTGRHVSPYGIETVQTPNLERLAAGGIRFVNAFSPCPHCGPARAALFSGMYPHAVGVMGNVGRDKGWRFPDDRLHAARIFAEAGYETGLVGMQHETYTPETLGFNRLIPAGEKNSIVDAAPALRRFLDERDRSKPYYCQIGCIETHRPWERTGEPPDDSLGVTVPPYLANGPKTGDDCAHFQGQITRFDRGVGEILDVLDTDDAENTIVVVTTDHGIPFPRAKGTLTDAGIGIFMFLRYPAGGMDDGRVNRAMINHVDVLPSLLDLCSVPAPEQIQGRSFIPLIDDDSRQSDDAAIFAEKTHFHFYDPMRCIRTRRYKYIRNFEFSRQTETPLDVVRTGTLAELENRYVGGHPSEDLYDLENDPVELINLADDPKYAVCKKELRSRLAEWMKASDDPLLNGPIPSPVYYRSLEEMGLSRG